MRVATGTTSRIGFFFVNQSVTGVTLHVCSHWQLFPWQALIKNHEAEHLGAVSTIVDFQLKENMELSQMETFVF